MQSAPHRYHHGDLRAALLVRAEETLREKGRGALSLRELARDLGVSHAAPGRHFKDKQALLDALAFSGFERLGALITACRERSGETFARRLEAVARTYVDFATSNAELLDLMYSAKHAPAASEALVASAHRGHEQVVELIGEGQRRGEVRPGSPERLTLAVFSAVHGYASLAASGMLPPGGDEYGLDDTITQILRGLAPDRTPPASS
ncbi:TetR/AcrR family transcriptional regulator [Streptomyces aidingensis]|uniref:DNA-binding transcriptional regulator, AcrR family n=1 Tax=Streptomyces aidingensis TaxID=910347 RepID=A0A1I1N8X6_9ACTN|nr:TetR/AcrR family transcriptional regulator [Streptomyces aidingensis]SFC93915.1 DNA-binding transcriptional regulator, AcrR family [Streptomyces aidingensis]